MNTAKVQNVVSSLDYDFRTFELQDFIDHIERRRRRAIISMLFAFEPGTHGAWIPAETADYIFIDANAHVVHQIHTTLHELGHILLNHKCRTLDEVLLPEIFAQLQVKPPVGRLRFAPNDTLQQDPEEQECELFVGLIQRNLLNANRIEALTGRSSSIHRLQRFINSGF